MLNYQVENGAGTTVSYTPDDITAQLRQSGETPKSVSPDGLTITLADQQGEFQVKTADLLQHLGWKVNGIQPIEATEDYVDPMWRVAVASLAGDDQVKKLYLQEEVEKKFGVKDANIVGQGTDFYVFNPQANKYFALTNKSGLDMSDVASGLSQAPGFVGGALGGIAGAGGGMGVASIPGAIAGGVGGSLAGDVLARGALAGYDPTFRKYASQNLGAQAQDIGGNALMSGVTGGAFKGIPMAVGAMRGAGSQAPKLLSGLANSGPVSSLTRGLSAGAEEGGKIASTVAKPFMNKGLPQSLATSQGPLGTVQGVGMIPQAPSGLTRWGAKMYGKFGGQRGKDFVASIPKNDAGDLSVPALTEEIGRALGKKAVQREPLSASGKNFYKVARKQGRSPSEALDAARAPRVAIYGERGRKAGEFMERGAEYGRKLEKVADEATGLAAQGVYGLGRASQGVGAAVNRASRFAQPLENRLYTKYGAEENVKGAFDDLTDPYLRRRQNRINSMPDILAEQNYR